MKNAGNDSAVLISGYYGYDSRGDEGILAQIIQTLRDSKTEKPICVLSNAPEKTAETYGVQSVNRMNPAAVLHRMSNASLLISGGGSLLQDATSKGSLYYYCAIIAAARRLGVPVWIYANGLGPLSGPGVRIAASLLNCAQRVSLRDADSYRFAINCGVEREKLFLSADPVFMSEADYAGGKAMARSLGLVMGSYFAISVRRHALGRININEIAASVISVKRRYGLTPVYVSMQDSEDSELLCQLYLQCGGVIAPGMDLSVLEGFLSGARISLGMRLHFLLCAAKAGSVPVALSCDCKIDSVMGSLGVTDILDAFNTDRDGIYRACLNALEADENQKSVIREMVEKSRRLAGRDSRYLSEAARRGRAKVGQFADGRKTAAESQWNA